MNITDNDELLDIVNEHDEVIGQRYRSQLILGKEYTIRSINVFIENDQGQLWIPRRTKDKKVLPLALDLSVSGCVSSGETYEQAFAREVAEEVNLDIVPLNSMQLSVHAPMPNIGKQLHIMKAVDRVNKKLGRNTVFFAAAGVEQPWKMKQLKKSQCFTTSWHELLTVQV